VIVDLNLRGKKVLVIGGGTEGMRKVNGLLGQNCKITVISNRLNSYFKNLANEGKIEIIKKKIDNSNLDFLDNYKDSFLLLASTDDRKLNRAMVNKGRTFGAFVYSVDDPQYSDFSYASIINIEGVMQVAISTEGKSPIMARKIRMKAERIIRKIITPSDIENAKLQEFARYEARLIIKTVKERKAFLYSIINDKNIQSLIRENKVEEARLATLDLLRRWGNDIP